MIEIKRLEAIAIIRETDNIFFCRLFAREIKVGMATGSPILANVVNNINVGEISM